MTTSLTSPPTVREVQHGHPDSRRSAAGPALAIALLSAASFGLSGSLARSLLDLGWTPSAVVAVRIGGAFALLVLPCLVLLARTGLPSVRQTARLLAYGVVAVAVAQLCYFSAVQYLSVGVALLLEYLAPVLLIFFEWVRSRRRPAASVFGGALLALLGLVFVLDLRGDVALNPVGVAWGLGAALCLCAYFVLSEGSETEASVPPLLLTTAGTGVGGLVVAAVTAAGVLPFAAPTGTTVLAGSTVGWWLPALLLVGITAVLAYLTGIVAVRRLGSPVASFVSLAEVIFAVAFAVVLLGQQPSATQLLGGALVLAGIVVVQRAAR